MPVLIFFAFGRLGLGGGLIHLAGINLANYKIFIEINILIFNLVGWF
jgi:hypothetical protein